MRLAATVTHDGDAEVVESITPLHAASLPDREQARGGYFSLHAAMTEAGLAPRRPNA